MHTNIPYCFSTSPSREERLLALLPSMEPSQQSLCSLGAAFYLCDPLYGMHWRTGRAGQLVLVLGHSLGKGMELDRMGDTSVKNVQFCSLQAWRTHHSSSPEPNVHSFGPQSQQMLSSLFFIPVDITLSNAADHEHH